MTFDGEPRRVAVPSEQHIVVMSEAEAEKHRMTHIILEQQIATESVRMKLDAELMQAHDIAATTPEESQALRGSIAKHESTYFSLCWKLITEREVRPSSSARAPESGAILGELERLRARVQDTRADNEQLMHDLFATVS